MSDEAYLSGMSFVRAEFSKILRRERRKYEIAEFYCTVFLS